MIRLGLIGSGWVAQLYGQAVEQMTGRCEWAWAADPNLARANDFCSRFGGEPLADHRGATADAYIVATPHHLHAPIYLDIVDSGAPVLVEKPLALTVDECDRMIAERDRVGGLLMVGFASRFRRGSQAIKRELDRGAIGKPMFADAFQFGDQSDYVGGWLLKRETLGGGCFFSSGGHLVDLLSWILGPICRLRLETGSYRLHEMEGEDTGLALARFESGALATIRESWAVRGTEDWQHLSIYGSDGQLRMTYTPRSLVPDWHTCLWDTTVTLTRPDGSQEIIVKDSAQFDCRSQFEHFLQCIETGRQPLTDAESAREVIRLVREAEAEPMQ